MSTTIADLHDRHHAGEDVSAVRLFEGDWHFDFTLLDIFPHDVEGFVVVLRNSRGGETRHVLAADEAAEVRA